jgi:hypothetical protein
VLFFSSEYIEKSIKNLKIKGRCTEGAWTLHLISSFFTKWRILECSRAPLSFSLRTVAKLLFSCLGLLDAIVKLHAIDKKKFNDFFPLTMT